MQPFEKLIGKTIKNIKFVDNFVEDAYLIETVDGCFFHVKSLTGSVEIEEANPNDLIK